MDQDLNIFLPEKLNFRVYGRGPAIILFHPSPNSAMMMDAFAKVLCEHHTVICPDTPGYGDSATLSKANPVIKDYVDQFKLLFDQLGLSSYAIYGSATGGQIAIRFGIEYPDSVSHLYLDNCAHFTEQERIDIKKNYFPDLTPDIEGSHLIKVWDIVSHLFQYFPWCFKDDEHKLHGPMPSVNILHAIALDYMRAGPNYDIGYKAAFDHEKVEYIQALKVPATIFRWEGSILKKYTDRIFTYALEENIKGQAIPADRNLRFQSMSSCVQETHHNKMHYSREELIKSDIIKEALKTSKNESDLIVQLPQPNLKGDYLLEAWSLVNKQLPQIENENSKDRAMRIQKCLIGSYVNHQTI